MKRKLITATLTAIALSLPTAIASAAPDPTTGVELNVNQDRFSAIEASFNPALGRTEGLPALRELRSAMWDVNPYLSLDDKPTNKRLRDVAAENNLPTREMYVASAIIDQDLTWIAIQRASEATHRAVGLTHSRTDGTTPSTAKRGSTGLFGENLAMNSTGSLRTAVVDQWGHGELAALNASRGVYRTSNGHLHMLINPRNGSFGFAKVSTKLNGRSDTVLTAVTNPYLQARADNSANQVRNVWLHNAAGPDRAITGLKTGTPSTNPPAPNPDPIPGQTIGSDFSNPAAIVGTIIAALTFLGGLWAIIQQFLPRR
ncbi:hypothetical protein [Corynebacterium auriscanis]|uniref:hypothetical protein n=1 Tax=Corynebacterium auriscanis TaxID=99807 RepID=UPI00224521BF|nr:hypothetical protein [Corynebacterium auriscanis]MCX2163240.1 hypothetical protein [Corynebacterium auriscanis]